MLTIYHLSGIILAYLVGSIPTAVWVGKAFYKIDVREFGSGNAGATNTFRVLGKKAGIPVLLFDVVKGSIAVLMAFWFSSAESDSPSFINFQLALGVAALLGHIFPIYAGFRGGKGIATLLGIMIAIQPEAALWCIGVFLMVFLSTKYVSLASIISSICFPLIVNLVYHTEVPSLMIFSVFIAIMVVVTHQKNIERLIRQNESKANFSLTRSRQASGAIMRDEEDESDDAD